MAEPQDDADKQHEPTQKKLDDARRKGEVPRSADLGTAAAYGGFLLVSVSIGAATLRETGSFLAGLIEHSASLSADVFSGGGRVASGTILSALGAAFLPWFLVPGIFVLVANIALRSFTVAPEKLKPKLNRISLIANAKNKFGRSGLFEFAKSFAKLTIFSLVLGVFLFRQLPQILATVNLSPGMATVVLLSLGVRFFAIVLVIALVIGTIDYLWQRQEHLRKNRMSHKELMDESKQSEGDPHMKQQRRQRGYEIAMNHMLGDVPNADVVVVNPTHYAVALKWSRLPGEAPVCVAKGVDQIAARIREAASEAGVPIHRDPPTARAIHATVEIGGEIRPEHYQAIAAAIRFAEEMRRKVRERSGRSDVEARHST
ncbi:EscU/YscU/HrcU family type III secretion system export apparatus switch protein [Sinisalibacter lacisalsi]|uniref:Flagellar biosynthesis protein FlhB n=1 Tax=Sinisalibacter lacisalsi TaxID=1526570 RepID=A0ABQ1QDS1_9RHOB|nr:flagellar type III secretion system protein FlhB [Sinisalibacter lacisalsi]GGD22843.1 flagellar biosynthesis protein FlhB [Sinisalibacter lacisalsi]